MPHNERVRYEIYWWTREEGHFGFGTNRDTSNHWVCRSMPTGSLATEAPLHHSTSAVLIIQSTRYGARTQFSSSILLRKFVQSCDRLSRTAFDKETDRSTPLDLLFLPRRDTLADAHELFDGS